MLSRSFLIAVVLVASLSGAVAAQDAPNATAENSTAETCEYITESLSLCSAEYDGDAATLVLDSDNRESITVTEAVSLSEPRELNRRSFVVNGRTEIRFAVEPTDRQAGVTIDDGSTLYGVPLETTSTIVAGPFTASDAQAAGLGGGVGVAVVTIFLVAKVVYGRSEEPERLA